MGRSMGPVAGVEWSVMLGDTMAKRSGVGPNSGHFPLSPAPTPPGVTW